MQTISSGPDSPDQKSSSITRRIREFSLIGRDPVLSISLLLSGIFIFVFVVFPLYRSAAGGFISKEGAWDITYFARYFDNYYGPALRQSFYRHHADGVVDCHRGDAGRFHLRLCHRALPDPRKAFRALAGARPDCFTALCPGTQHDPVIRPEWLDHAINSWGSNLLRG